MDGRHVLLEVKPLKCRVVTACDDAGKVAALVVHDPDVLGEVDDPLAALVARAFEPLVNRVVVLLEVAAKARLVDAVGALELFLFLVHQLHVLVDVGQVFAALGAGRLGLVVVAVVVVLVGDGHWLLGQLDLVVVLRRLQGGVVDGRRGGGGEGVQGEVLGLQGEGLPGQHAVPAVEVHPPDSIAQL